MKNFDDLVFVPIYPNAYELKATLEFNNGYSCIVYKNSPSTNRELPYEYELIPPNSNISDDNIGYCSKEEIISLLRESQNL